ncbi:hypothetical protein BC332_32761 [Capsicum chinense]|nr:putative transcription factor-like [Capsicum annuum]KAF3678518.1 putative transcription factor-like [Capsicum annuum]PHT98321.1 hypothetical protein BC332_32761 [Capsicum chinense]
MEGLIPFVYRAIMDYKNNTTSQGGQLITNSPRWMMNSDSPLLGAYMRLSSGSGRFDNSEIQLFGSPDNGLSMNSSSSSSNTAGKRSMVSGGSPTTRCHWISTRAVNR